ncbi:MAG: hemolysin family protein [Planctomycetota bacterium]|nr:hemolysin family protein [Planctomycetota bacterium]
MSDLVGPIALGLLSVWGFLIAWGCYSLRDFSRSRLEEVCEQSGNSDRFGIILRTHEHALLATDIVLGLTALVSLPLGLHLFGLWGADAVESLGWPVYVSRSVLLGGLFLVVYVVLPWTMSRVAGETYLGKCWRLFAAIRSMLGPLLSTLFKLDRIVHRLGGVQEPSNGDGETIAEEIRSVVDEGRREGLLESGAGTMIQRVMELQEEDAAAIMTPRTDMFCIQAETELEEARRRLLDAGHSRIPVYGVSTDDIIGVLYAKDLLRHIADSNGETPALRDIVREPFYVPETSGIGDLLETMKHKQVQLAIVLDEYGGVAGLVTMEDILEEIVGEIADEYDPAEKQVIKQIDAQTFEVDARVHIDDLNDQFQYDLPEDDDFDTIGGFVFSRLGRVPTANDEVTWRKLRITVLDADKRKINRLRLQIDASLTESVSE